MNTLTTTLFCALACLFLFISTSFAQSPEQVHLSLTENAGEMRVIWIVQVNFNTQGQYRTGNCSVGLTSGKYSATFTATSSTYSEQGFNGTIFNAVLKNLSPDTFYYYTCGDAISGYSKEFTFKSAPVPGVNRTIHFVQWGDMGVRNSNDSIASLSKDLAGFDYEMIVIGGDSGYQDDFPSPNAYILDNFYNMLEPFASKMPMMMSDGNHDEQQSYVQFLHRIQMPQPWTGAANLSRFYYSFDYGPVHFIVYSTDGGHEIGSGSEQYNFIVADLAKVNTRRSITPWVVAMTHHPMYCSALTNYERCHPQATAFRKQIEQVLYEGKVDVHISGHNHMMERSYPVYQGKVTSKSLHNADAPVYLVNGAGGNVEGNAVIWELDVAHRAAHSKTFHKGYARMHVNSTHFEWDYVDASGNTIIDNVVLSKD